MIGGHNSVFCTISGLFCIVIRVIFLALHLIYLIFTFISFDCETEGIKAAGGGS